MFGASLEYSADLLRFKPIALSKMLKRKVKFVFFRHFYYIWFFDVFLLLRN